MKKPALLPASGKAIFWIHCKMDVNKGGRNAEENGNSGSCLDNRVCERGVCSYTKIEGLRIRLYDRYTNLQLSERSASDK
jgi:hypothetical protein